MKKKRMWIGFVGILFLCIVLFFIYDISYGTKKTELSKSVKELHLGVVLDDKISFSNGR